MYEDPDFQQARLLLATLETHIEQLTRRIEKAERQRTPRSSAGQIERDLRRELAEAHGHVGTILERFPEVRTTL